tara:strand:+ start:208 stop:1044 length:837 start_codon:yes stop_codon:yes gene_type:complete
MSRKFKLVSGSGSGGNQYVNVSESGKITLSQALDYESFTDPSFSIRVECSDERGHSVFKNFTINILDEEEIPTPSPAPSPDAVFSDFGGPCSEPGFPLTLRLYKIGALGANGLKTDSNFVGKFNTRMCSHQINVPSQSYTVGFPNMPSLSSNFAAVWDGQIYAPVSGTYKFATTSDDRAILYMYQNGLSMSHRNLIIDDDYGNHPMQWSKTGTIFLDEGLHAFQVRFQQGPPTHLGVVLHWNINNVGALTNNLTPVPREAYFSVLPGQIYILDTNGEP